VNVSATDAEQIIPLLATGALAGGANGGTKKEMVKAAISAWRRKVTLYGPGNRCHLPV